MISFLLMVGMHSTVPMPAKPIHALCLDQRNLIVLSYKFPPLEVPQRLTLPPRVKVWVAPPRIVK
jgi:hypothetical protein